MIYVTGDIHGGFDIHKLSSKELRSAGLRIEKDDYVIVCGDFGLVWDNKPEERYWPLCAKFNSGQTKPYL